MGRDAKDQLIEALQHSIEAKDGLIEALTAAVDAYKALAGTRLALVVQLRDELGERERCRVCRPCPNHRED